MGILMLIMNITKQIAYVSNLNEYEVKVRLYEQKLLLKDKSKQEVIVLD